MKAKCSVYFSSMEDHQKWMESKAKWIVGFTIDQFTMNPMLIDEDGEILGFDHTCPGSTFAGCFVNTDRLLTEHPLEIWSEDLDTFIPVHCFNIESVRYYDK